MSRRTVFFVSDQTGVTAETLGHSLMTQFEGLEFRPVTLPFVSSLDKAHEAVRRSRYLLDWADIRLPGAIARGWPDGKAGEAGEDLAGWE